MKRTLIAAIAAVFTSAAYAGNENGCQGNCPQGGGTQDQQQGQLQGQAQGQLQGQGQFSINKNTIGAGFGNFSPKSSSSSTSKASAGAAAGAYSGGNKQTMIYKEAEIPTDTRQEIKYSGSYDVKTNPPVFAPSINPSSPCMGSTVIGGSGGLVGLTIGTSWKDDDCGYRETARMFNEIGQKADAIAVLCASEYAKNAPACKGQAKTAEATPLAPSPVAKAEPQRTDDRRVAAANLVTSPDGRRWTQQGDTWVQVGN